MVCDDIHVGDTNTALSVTLTESAVAVDISSATTKQVKLLAPSGILLTKVAEFVTDGSDGRIYYLTEALDLTEKGTWKIQAYIEMPTWSGHSDIGKFKVLANVG